MRAAAVAVLTILACATTAIAEETCTVYGMPRAVGEAGLADVVAPLDELPAAIAAEVRS